MFATLRAWVGYPVLRNLMAELPELDIHLAGGVIRNLVLGLPQLPKDFDFFFRGVPTEAIVDHLQSASGRLSTTSYGSPRWRPSDPGQAFCEFIPLADFAPIWPCQNMTDALVQFDFTGNAMAFDLRTGKFLNPVNGYRDMHRRIMRAVRFDHATAPTHAGSRVCRAALHWARILHYAAMLRLDIELVTMRWLCAKRSYGDRDFGRFFRHTRLDLSLLPRDGSSARPTNTAYTLKLWGQQE
jgi:hypothetical protein